MNHELTTTISLGIITCFAIYLIFMYTVSYRKLMKDSIPQSHEYSRDKLKTLFVKAINVLVKNANMVAHPYFFNQPIDYILSICPSFIDVLKFVKYTLENPTSKNDVHDILLEMYGHRFEESVELNVLVKIHTSEFGVQEYDHYIMQDVEKATYLYIHNKEYLDKLIL